MYTVEVEVHGPLFDGGWQPALDEFVHDAVQDVGAQGLAYWHTNLDTSLQHPTGYYESQIISELVAPDIDLVHDRGVVYGPWLEGTGSRNQTTKFKGYAAQRRAAQQLEGQIDRILVPAIAKLTRRLEGA